MPGTRLYITEYRELAKDAQDNVIAAGLEPPLANHSVDIGAVSAQSAVFQDATTIVRLQADVGCNVKFGGTPVAVQTEQHMEAGQTEFYGVPIGQSIRVAVIEETP